MRRWGKLFGPVPFPLSVATYSFPPRSRRQKGHARWASTPWARNRSARPSLRATLFVKFCGVDHRNGIAGHVGRIQPATVAVDGQRVRLSAEIALLGQARIEVTLHGKLTARQYSLLQRHRGWRARHRASPSGEKCKRAGMRSRSDWALRLEQRQLSPHDSAREIEFRNLRCVPQRDKSALAVSRYGQRYRICRRDRVALGKIEALLRSCRWPHRAGLHRRKDSRRRAVFRAPASPITAIAAGYGSP